MIPLLFFIYGIVVGSFLNVCIYRIPNGLSVAKGRSFCPGCGHPLSWLDLVPVFSYLFLRGKCRYCKAPISPRYALVELTTGVLFLLAALVFGLSLTSVLLCVWFCVLVCASFIDLEHTWIPDRLHLVSLAVAAVSLADPTGPALSSRLLGFALVGGGMFLLSWLTGGGIGGGDVKLMACAGLFLGLPKTLLAFLLGYVMAGLRYLFPFLRKKLPAGFEVPMAPWLSAGLSLSALIGDRLLAWYFKLL